MMIIEKYDRWIGIFSDSDYLKVLFYLKEYNPHVLFSELQKQLGIDHKILDNKLNELIEAGLIEITSEAKTGYTLTISGCVGVNRALDLVEVKE